jgi:hypothetical protein
VASKQLRTCISKLCKPMHKQNIKVKMLTCVHNRKYELYGRWFPSSASAHIQFSSKRECFFI